MADVWGAARWLATLLQDVSSLNLAVPSGTAFFLGIALQISELIKCLAACAVALGLAPAAASAAAPPPCPPAFGAVDRSVGPTTVYLGADPADPELCRMKRGDDIEEFYFGSWNKVWPGAEAARLALRKIYAGPPGSSVTFDVSAGPGLQWHDTLRNGGTESLRVLGQVFPTMRVVHEREGFNGNSYHSIITGWKDLATGMTIYQNYQHISGHPEPGAAWDPVSITGGR